MIAPTPFFADRGCHVRIYEEARALQSLGNKVEIVTYHIGREMPGIVTHRIPSIPWYKKMEAGPSWHKPYLDILLLFKALQVAKKFKPDLIHAHLHEGALVGVLLKKLLRIPLLFDCQGSLTGEIIDHGFCRKDSLLSGVFKVIESFINKSTNVIITSSSLAANDLVEKWGMPKHAVTALTDAVNTEDFIPFDREQSRSALNLSAESPVVAFLGVFNRYQGVDLLLDVIRRLKARGVKVHFLLMGFPDERYRQLAEEMGIAGMITFTGKIEYKKAPLYLSAADLAISPKISLTEANGKLFNYLACGLPVLVFDTPVNREILGEVGVYAKYADAEDFTAKLEELISDPDKMQLLGQEGRRKAIAEHSWISRGERLVKVYATKLND
jgi:glycosyltransferase involved in cell wall biosynthesis